MKKILICDDFCPLCNAYTLGFKKCNMIDERITFSNISAQYVKLINLNRARNEIPYIDTKNNQVFYGIDALSQAIGNKLPFLKPIIQFPFIKIPLLYLYMSSFITLLMAFITLRGVLLKA